MAAVGEVEGFVDQREVRDNVVDDGMLEHRPVVPRRVVWVTAADRPMWTGFECDTHRPTPALNQPGTDGSVGWHGHRRNMQTVRQLGENVLDQATRLLQLIESHRHAGGDITLT